MARLLAAAVLVITAGFVVAPGAASPVQAADTLGSGGEYHPLTPVRIFDSRPANPINDVAPFGAKPQAAPEPATFDIALLGKGGIPAEAVNVLAVDVNITVTEPGANGYLEAYGTGARPGARTSIVNFVTNQTVPNVAIVRPGDGGALTIGLYGLSGSAHVIVDVFGWFSSSNFIPNTTAEDDGARLIPTTPSRIFDTREGIGTGGVVAALTAKQTIAVQIRGADGVNPTATDVIPDSPNVKGVLLNIVGLTTDPGGTNTYVSVIPEDLPTGQNPTTSNLNLPPNVIKANLVFAPVGSDGKVRIFNYQGVTHVVADVVGYLLSTNDTDPNKLTRKGRVVPLTSPYRAFDTRVAVPWGGVALGPGQAEDWSFADFAASVNIGSAPVGNQLGVIGNLTSAALTRQYASVAARSYLTVYPANEAKPFSSNLNTVEGAPIPNMAVLKYSTDNMYTVRVYNDAGFDHYIFDASAVVLAD